MPQPDPRPAETHLRPLVGTSHRDLEPCDDCLQEFHWNDLIDRPREYEEPLPSSSHSSEPAYERGIEVDYVCPSCFAACPRVEI